MLTAKGIVAPSLTVVTVFFIAPEKVVGCVPILPATTCSPVGDFDGTDKISTNLSVVYAEVTNGGNPSPNSNLDIPQTLVVLGTANPTDVKSAVPKSGAKFFTGAGGFPKNATDQRLAETVIVPSLTSGDFTTASLVIVKVNDSDNSVEGSNCLTAGHFKECPTYSTTIAGTFPNSPWLKTIYRIDASNLKMSGPKILNSVSIKYTNTLRGFNDKDVPKVCTNDQPETGANAGLPCVLSSICYRKNDTGGISDLEYDCEWTLINIENGLIKIF